MRCARQCASTQLPTVTSHPSAFSLRIEIGAAALLLSAWNTCMCWERLHLHGCSVSFAARSKAAVHLSLTLPWFSHFTRPQCQCRPHKAVEGWTVVEEQNSLAFMHLSAVVRGVLLCPVFGTQRTGLFYPVHTVDSDMFVRLNHLKFISYFVTIIVETIGAAIAALPPLPSMRAHGRPLPRHDRTWLPGSPKRALHGHR